MRIKFLIIIVLLLVFSCGEDSKVKTEIESIDLEVEIERFDQLFANATVDNLSSLKAAYPFMFSEKYPDSIWVNRIQDTLQQQLSEAVSQTFSDDIALENDVTLLFKHLKHYFPEFRKPRVITTTSFVDYRNQIIVTDTIALVSLDTYLGKDHEFYDGIQKYLKQNFTSNQIVVDLASKYAEKFTYKPSSKTLLDEMIYHGKLLYIKDLVIPFKTDAEKIGYSQDQLDWAEANESEIWRYLVERELLFSTDSELPARFINPAPFTKFYLELDAESPGKLGRYIGWQIVKAYMNTSDYTLKQMLNKNAEVIFNNSKFKPRK